MKNKKVVFVVVGIVAFILICLIIRGCNMSRKAKNNIPEPSEEYTEETQQTLQQDIVESEAPTSSYQSSLGLGAGDKDGRVSVEDEPEEPSSEVVYVEPKAKYNTEILIWGKTGVPAKNMDGSSCKSYLNSVKLSDFGTMWGSSLTEDDFNGGNFYMVGVEQNPDDTLKGDLQSVGWLMDNISSINDNDAVKFTNLHVIGSLSDSHCAVLCSYDWYSAFGLRDTLVVFEDISGTLDKGYFGDGDIFSATVFGHNIKLVESVKGQRVIVVEYDTFD